MTTDQPNGIDRLREMAERGEATFRPRSGNGRLPTIKLQPPTPTSSLEEARERLWRCMTSGCGHATPAHCTKAYEAAARAEVVREVEAAIAPLTVDTKWLRRILGELSQNGEAKSGGC